MLKWAVNSKRGEAQVPSRLSLGSSGIPDSGKRRSLAAPQQHQSHRRRSRRSLHNIDKENLDYAGNTPAFSNKEVLGLRKLDFNTGVLKDVSNITPNSPTPNSPGVKKSTPKNRRSSGHNVRKSFGTETKFIATPKSGLVKSLIPNEPAMKRRRIILDKDIYVDETESKKDDNQNENNNITNNNKFSQSDDVVNKIGSQTNLDDFTQTKTNKESTKDVRFNIQKVFAEQSLVKLENSTKNIIPNDTMFEIEYSPITNISCRNQNSVTSTVSTLPVIGSRIFINNPLYFKPEINSNNEEHSLPSKKPKTDFDDNFSRLLNKLSPLSALRHQGFKDRMKVCSDVSPLARRMASLCFNRLNTNLSAETEEVKERTSKSPIDLKRKERISSVRDEEFSVELETKTISDKNLTGEESTITDSKMGDITLERLIEDILKSTKKVKKARRIRLQAKNESKTVNHDVEANLENVQITPNKSLNELVVESSPLLEIPISPLVINNLSHDEVKTALVKSLKDDTESRPSDTKIRKIESCLEPEKTYIMYDSFNSNEREVKTPENRLSLSANIGMETLLKNCSLNTSRKRANSLGYTPSISLNFNLKRQRCVRRKKQFNRESVEDVRSYDNETVQLIPRSEDGESVLTLKCGIPSPLTPAEQSYSRILKSTSFNSITSYPFIRNQHEEVLESNGNRYENVRYHQISSPTLNSVHFGDSRSPCMSTSGYLTLETSVEQKLFNDSNKMFGLTLDCGIPSPASPFATRWDDFNLDTPGFCSSFMTDGSAQKCVDDSLFSDPATPSIDAKPARRCLTFSPEDGDDADFRDFPRSRLGLILGQVSSGTIDLIMESKDDQILVHIIRCRNLVKQNGSTSHVNAYCKVNLSGVGVYQRTPVRRNTLNPTFDRKFVFSLPEKCGGRRIQVSVWHRDSQKRRSEFLGWVSFSLRHALRRPSRLPIAAGQYSLRAAGARRSTGPRPRDEIMAASTTNNFISSATNIDDQIRDSDGPSALAARLAQGQREADDHLFLRYLELDPIEGPDADTVAVQRKASGKAQGRTPFTTTRKLERGTDSGFGFSVLWTHPPRVERVDAGRAAERAGLHPGDYIVFVDRHNVVTMPESQVLNLIKTSGTSLVLETFRRSQHTGEPKPQVSMSRLPRGSVTSHATLSDAAQYSPAPLPKQILSRLGAVDSSSSQWKANRPSTACSNNTARSDAVTTSVASKKRPALPQVAFTRESLSALTNQTSGGPRELGLALHAIILREQHYKQALRFGVERFVVPMTSRTDILTANEHKLLFQNCDEVLRLTEDILEQLVSEDGEISFHLIPSVYLSKMPTFITLYKSYCNGLKRADCVLVQKSRQQGGAFTNLCTEPAIPSRKPDITQFLHKPLEQFRELLRLLRAANGVIQAGHPDQKILAKLVTDLQHAYHDVTASAGIMGPIGEGRPLLSVSDLESRLVFTRCKPFVLAKPGRQWIFGGDLVRVEGRSSRSHWALLFSDLLLFATVSRDRVLFITEEPLLIANIAETCFSIRKRPTEFRIGIGNGRASSPTARCGPPVRTKSRTIVLRAPTTDLKAVWQTLLLRQILRVNSANGTPLSSPMESPAVPLACYSEVTLDSQMQHQPGQSTSTPAPGAQQTNNETATARPSPSTCRGAALHLARWMRTHPGSVGSGVDLLEEPEPEIWSAEQLKKRSQELKLLDRVVQPAATTLQCEPNKSPSENEHSPSRSTNSDSQITVRSSPVVPETVSVCRQCHKKCFSKPSSPQISSKTLTSSSDKNKSTSPINNGYLTVNHVCTKNHIPETKIDYVPRCSKENCIAETKITNSPIKTTEVKEEKSDKEERLSHRAAIRKSREEFFKSTPVSSCTSPLSRTSKSPSSQSPCSQRSSDSSRSTLFSTNSIMSFAQTTCSSMGLSTSNSKYTQSPERDSNASGSSGTKEDAIQFVIAQEKYLNEVKCVENVVLKNSMSPRTRFKDVKTYRNVSRTFAETMNKSSVNNCASPSRSLLNNNVGSSNTKIDSNSSKINSPPFSSVDFLANARKVATVNGDIRKNFTFIDSAAKLSETNSTNRSGINFSWSPLMLMGLSSMNPAAHILALDSEADRNRPTPYLDQATRAPHTSPTRVPNIAVVPPTPDFISDNKTMMSHNLEDSPDDSPVAEDLPYTALKRYGTMSSLEKLPSDELDDAQLGHQGIFEKENSQPQGLFSWTSRAGSYVAEKMALLNSLAESGAASTGASFLERYLGTGEWRAVRGSVGGAEGSGGEGSGASGEEAWGTPSSGDLSDHAFPDEDHATLSSPTKSSSSCPGDDDTELMMDELLMTPPITGPSLRPLLPRRRLEPLLEEDGSETSSNSSAAGSDITPSPIEKQESRWERRGENAAAADARGATRPSVVDVSLPLMAMRTDGAVEDFNRQRQRLQLLQRQQDDPELTPTNGPEHASLLLLNVLHPSVCARRASTPSSTTSEKTLPAEDEAPELWAEREPTATVERPGDNVGRAVEEDGMGEVLTERLSPRMEMRLALQEGTDMLAEQDHYWDQVQGPLGWVRRPIFRPCRPVGPTTLIPLTQGHTITSHSSVFAQQEEAKVTAMERLAYLEARGGRRGARRIRPAARIMGLVRRRTTSNSPERRPYSPRRHQPHVSNQGYYKICFVNGSV